MCLIAYSPEGKSLDKTVFMHAGSVNPDGVGVMSRKEVVKFLGHKASKKAWKYVQQLVAEGIPYGVHWRWATHGDVIFDNCHPFTTTDGHFLMHNGVLSKATAASTALLSDTAIYVRDHLEALPADMADETYFKALETDIGYGNKFLIMSPTGVFKVVNAKAGEWHEGFWYSNTYSLPDEVVRVIRKSWYSGAGTNTSRYGNIGNHWTDMVDGDGYSYSVGNYYSEHYPKRLRTAAAALGNLMEKKAETDAEKFESQSHWQESFRKSAEARRDTSTDVPVTGAKGVKFIAGADGRIRVVEGSHTATRIRNATEEERYQYWLEKSAEPGYYDEGYTPRGTREAVAEAVKVAAGNPNGFSPRVVTGLKESGHELNNDGVWRPKEVKQVQVPGGDFAEPALRGTPEIDAEEEYEDNSFKAQLKRLARSIHL